jgi:hypothetical protein
VLVGAAAAAVAASAKAVAAAPALQRYGSAKTPETSAPVRRYMAASAVLGDGRILIAGGYDRPWTGGDSPLALSSAVIFDPRSGTYSNAAPMLVPRARHAAVALRDGRVAVLGGIGLAPTASVEVYDPSTDTWQVSAPLAQPRYDHTAAYDGNAVYVIGGSAQAMLSSVEAVYPGAAGF